jgi:hypothetical protein
MNTKSVLLIGSLLVSITGASGIAFAEGNNVDQSKNVFIERTILGNWKPDVTAISNETPDVAKSLDLFADTVLGKTPRITPAVTVGKPARSETASDTFTTKFQSNYRNVKS